MLAGDDYYSPLIEAGMKDPLNFMAPMRGLSLGNRLGFLNQSIQIHKRLAAIARSYELFGQVSGTKGMGLYPLRDILAEEASKTGRLLLF